MYVQSVDPALAPPFLMCLIAEVPTAMAQAPHPVLPSRLGKVIPLHTSPMSPPRAVMPASWPEPSNCQATWLRRRQDGSYLPAATVPPRSWPPAWVAVQRLQEMMSLGKGTHDLSSRCRGWKAGEGVSRALCLVEVCQGEALRTRLQQESRWWNQVLSFALETWFKSGPNF